MSSLRKSSWPRAEAGVLAVVGVGLAPTPLVLRGEMVELAIKRLRSAASRDEVDATHRPSRRGGLGSREGRLPLGRRRILRGRLAALKARAGAVAAHIEVAQREAQTAQAFA